MSRFYEMHVEIDNVNDDVKDAVIEACQDEWNFEEWNENPESEKSRKGKYRLESWGQSNLGGGESEEEFVKRLKAAIWKAAGTYVPVVVYATYMENLPCETYESTETEFKEWKEAEDAEEDD